jgi:glycosyltransferase involved in cell wall biosynthesis/peptidoglycan/xylan/chitin deacetylase (PgdA/CDA1 family)/ubiquinone/menaquinone biosynthesis C-methylase UbiE
MASPGYPRTSVIIPARNAGQTLAETLDSLLAQSDPDWEALIINDGSTDETADIIECYVKRDRRFVGLQGAGLGASGARNIGLASATGQRVLFLDSDDWIDHRFLMLMNSALDTAPDADLAYCGYSRVMSDGQQQLVEADPLIAQAPFEMLSKHCAPAIHAVLLNRNILDRVGDFDTDLRTCEDWDLWQRIARLGGRWIPVEGLFSYYRASVDSLSGNIGQMLADARVVIGRCFSVDERLSEADDHYPLGASSADGWTADLVYYYFVISCAAFEIGRGADGVATLGALRNLKPSSDYSRYVVETLFDGVMLGLRAIPAQLAARWPDFGFSMTGLIAELGRIWNDPVAARRVQYGFERLVLDYDDLAQPRHLFLTVGLRVDLRNPAPLTPPMGVDRLYVYLCDGPDVLALANLGTLGTITSRHWLEIAVARIGFAAVHAIAAPSLGHTLTLHKLGHALREASLAPREVIRRSGLLRIRAAAAQKALLSASGPPRQANSHEEILFRLQKDADQAAKRLPTKLEKPIVPASRDNQRGSYSDPKAYWENVFQEPDPWNYGSSYEQEKYSRQLLLLPDRPIDRALEIACAEGHFTENLALRVVRLIATDISPTALDRARDRCRALDNIDFRQLDLAIDPLPQNLDLIVCSEVLYYLYDETELKRVAEKFTAALKPGGHLLTAHAFELKEDSSRTGFDWGNPWGAKTIQRVFSAVPGLYLERSISTELYRIDRFVRLVDGSPSYDAVIETLPINAEIDVELDRQIVWGGATARRADLAVIEQHRQVPVLMYHRIADEGPPELAPYRVSPEMFRAQMRWLRRNGYHTIVSEELAWFLANSHPFVGRPVMITFDDGYQDFADIAWPLLRRHDFRAEVFVITDLVGGQADWDCRFGEPASLMDPETIAVLAAQGACFGSHLASHRGADGLSTRELAEELLRSRHCLAHWTGQQPCALAAPFGLTDQRLEWLAAECGYRIGFSTEYAAAALTDDPMRLPRLEVQGDWDLGEFVRALEGCR